MRSPRVEAVVAPTALAREGRDRHQLDRCDAELAQLAQARDDAVEGAHGTERADVELVDDEIVEREALPLWGPRQIDDRRRPSDPMRLPAGARVGPFATVQHVDVLVAVTSRQLGRPEVLLAKRELVLHAVQANPERAG